MLKHLFVAFMGVALWASAGGASFGQGCTPAPDSYPFNPAFMNAAGLNPEALPTAYVGVPYDEVIQFKALQSITNPIPLDIQSVVVNGIEGLNNPEIYNWLQYEVVSYNPADQGNVLTPYQGIIAGCIRLFGTPNQRACNDSLRILMAINTALGDVSGFLPPIGTKFLVDDTANPCAGACEPNPDAVTLNAGVYGGLTGISPAVVTNEATVGQPYSQTFQILAVSTASIAGVDVTFDSLLVTGIEASPSGTEFNWVQYDVASINNADWEAENRLTPNQDGLMAGCVRIYGTPTVKVCNKNLIIRAKLFAANPNAQTAVDDLFNGYEVVFQVNGAGGATDSCGYIPPPACTVNGTGLTLGATDVALQSTVSLPDGTVGENYEQVVQIKIRTEFPAGFLEPGQPEFSITRATVSATGVTLPSGNELNWVNVASASSVATDASLSFTPGNDGTITGCLKLSGLPTTPVTDKQVKVNFTFEVTNPAALTALNNALNGFSFNLKVLEPAGCNCPPPSNPACVPDPDGVAFNPQLQNLVGLAPETLAVGTVGEPYEEIIQFKSQTQIPAFPPITTAPSNILYVDITGVGSAKNLNTYNWMNYAVVSANPCDEGGRLSPCNNLIAGCVRLTGTPNVKNCPNADNPDSLLIKFKITTDNATLNSILPNFFDGIPYALFVNGATNDPCEQTSNITELIRRAMSVQIYPNPSNGAATATFVVATAGTATVEAITLDGRVVFRQQLENATGRQSVAIPDLSPGFYTVKVTTGGAYQAVKYVRSGY